jgi:hypothetical protein
VFEKRSRVGSELGSAIPSQRPAQWAPKAEKKKSSTKNHEGCLPRICATPKRGMKKRYPSASPLHAADSTEKTNNICEWIPKGLTLPKKKRLIAVTQQNMSNVCNYRGGGLAGFC